MRFISGLIERLRDERGMTMIELMVASVICAVGIVATVGVMDRSRDLSVKNEYREAMTHQGQRELEKLMELPWVNFSHGASVPTTSPYTGTPTGGNFAYDRNNTGVTEQLLSSSVNGQVPSSFSTWTDSASRLSGRIYRYVTRIDSNSRRLTIVVTATGASSTAKPILLSTIKTKPIT